MSEVFYQHLVEHVVPLNEVAIRELKGAPTALDLYTYLATGSTVTAERGQALSWDQLAKHLGNAADSKRFRQTVRETMQLVTSVYPNANVDVSGRRSSFILHQRRSRRSSLEPIYGSLESNRAASGKPCPKGQAKQRAGRRRCRKSKPWRFRLGRFSMESAKKLFCGLDAKRVLPVMSI